MNFKLPELDYKYDELEPHLDALTMEIHHTKHHAAYTNNFNNALKDAGVDNLSAEEIFQNVSKYSKAVRNHGGGYYNHCIFWKNISPNGGGKPKGELLKAIEDSFGSFEKFKEQYSTAAATQFGSGWAWLIKQGDKLLITSTSNQDNPIMDVVDEKERGTILLTIDVWEHAYYLKYQNRRPDFINTFWEIVNWEEVERRFKS